MTHSMSREMAVAEFKRWVFEFKKLKARLITIHDEEPAPGTMSDNEDAPDRRTDVEKVREDSVEKVIQNFMDGTFAMDEKGNITQLLAFPIGTTADIREIVYKPRVTGAEMDGMKNFNSDSGKTRAILAAMSGQPAAIIGKMDSTDLMTGGLLVPFYFLA